MVVPSIKAITDKWSVHVGRIRVQVLGNGEPLPSVLQAIVEAAGSDAWIEGSTLVDLCKQRSEDRGSGCNAPAEVKDLPVPLASGCDAPVEHEESPGAPGLFS